MFPNNYQCILVGKLTIIHCWLLLIMLFTESATISRELIISLVIAMASSIILLTSVFFIILFGCIYGRSWQKCKQSKEISDIKDAHLPAEQDLEMAENVAYGPLKWTTTK